MREKGLWKGKLLMFFILTAMTALLCGLGVSADEEVVMTQDSSGYLVYTGNFSAPVTVYHKFTAAGPALVTVTGGKRIGSNTSSLDVMLCNSKKQPLENYTAFVNVASTVESSQTRQYAVTKGTYYIKTTNAATYALSVKVDSKLGKLSITDPGGKSKKKAKTIKAKKTVCGVIGAGEKANKADWFKFKVKKSKVLYFDVEAAGNGSVRFTLYGPSFKKGMDIRSSLRNDSFSAKTVKTRFGSVVGKLKVKKGTYYIKVSRAKYYNNASDNALYSIKWR